ncbi:LamG-like jellyroll fold domain-containing protein [Aestuariibaculum suncheonense]|uniref:LamG-like jellyroll fold domain-containing protein n=1 Tax=Aestuariibaculum suncheonense TaxID=1028745 RepID=A0A8J6Q5M7_9FLAO|nr:LamG-like jellyroll fold domain-containing protein [Aestuariibaculum suncheonense]MBD0834679.1 hypothetical protein [Aestuariibaculum suncheonense]
MVLTINIGSYGQNDLTLKDYVFVTHISSDVINKLEQGGRAFNLDLEVSKSQYIVINSKDKRSLKSVLDSIQLFLNKNKGEIVALLIKGEFDKTQIENYIDFQYSGNVFFQTEQEDPKVEQLKQEGKRLIIVFDECVAESSINRIRSERKFSNWFTKDALDRLVEFRSLATSKSALYDDVLEFWKTTGKSPNFILADYVEFEEVKHVADSLNNLRRFRGIVEYNDEFLNEVYWKNAPQTITTAKFSFPLTTREQILSPYKNGYRISPAEVIHHKGQPDSPRLFTAYNVAIEDELKYDFSFDDKVVNKQDPDWNRIITKDVSFIKDNERGDVLYLSQEDSFVDYFKSNTLNFETPISISVWLKPDKIPQFMGILGFGTAFSVKLRKGSPDFTMATIKDHVVEYPLERGVWQHLVVVYNPRASIDFYINGQKIGDIQTSEINPSNQSLVIGNNIWGEQFFGAIDDLKVWDRGLSPAEVEQLYGTKIASKAFNWYLFFAVFLGGTAIGMVLFFRKGITLNKTRKKRQPQDTYYPRKITTERKRKNSLYLFGGFQLVTASENTPTFSPLQKQLVSYLILSVLEDDQGVNSNKLTETFWPGVSKEKAKENRSGNMRKLRKVLSEIEDLQIVFKEKKWLLSVKNDFVVDVFEYIRLKSSLEEGVSEGRISLNELEDFLDFIKKGNVLPGIQTEWVDYFKAKLSSEIEHLLAAIYKEQGAKIPKEICIKMAKTILLFDSLNENALQILISEWVAMGKHGLAKHAYTSFSKNYELLYREPYRVEYQDLVDF